MSIRKVSDLEPLSFTDGTYTSADINDSLLEFSVPQHGQGHSYKSMFTPYNSIRTDILSAVFSSDTSVVFTTPVEFEQTAYFQDGAAISGGLSVNADNPDWQNTTVYVRAGDISFVGNSVIELSAPAVNVYTNDFAIRNYSDADAILNVTNTKAEFNRAVQCRSSLSVSEGTLDNHAINLAQLKSEVQELRDWVQEMFMQGQEEEFKLESTELYTEDDIANCIFMLVKRYTRTINGFDNDGNPTTSTESFAEYDIKTAKPTDSSNKIISLPDILDARTISMTVSETTSYDTPASSQIRQTSVKYNVIDTSNADLAKCVIGIDLSGIATSETANIHIFAKTTGFTADPGRLIIYNSADNGMYSLVQSLNPSAAEAGLLPRNRNFYTFATPYVSIVKGGRRTIKFALQVNGRCSLAGVGSSSSLKVTMYAVFSTKVAGNSPSYSDGKYWCTYSGYNNTSNPNAGKWPFVERLCPRWKTGPYDLLPGQNVDVTPGGSKRTYKTISDANNGYFVKGKTYANRNDTKFAYAKRYAVHYKNTSGNVDVNSATDQIQTHSGKAVSIDTNYFVSIGSETVRASAGTFQFTKVFSLPNKAVKASSPTNWVSIVFEVNESSTGKFVRFEDHDYLNMYLIAVKQA